MWLSRGVLINLSLGFFNILPIPPLDGSKIFGVFLPENLYFRFTQMGQLGMIVLIVMLYMNLVEGIIGPLINITLTGMSSLTSMIFHPLFG